jgi:hypothetical protein
VTPRSRRAQGRPKRDARRREILVYTEGEKTEDGYLLPWRPSVPDAIGKAEANGINLAVSNPCIELWFILHFEDQTTYLARHEAQSRSSEVLGCGKNLTRKAMDRLFAEYETARNRAHALEAKHQGDGSPARSNPSSSVRALIDSIRR